MLFRWPVLLTYLGYSLVCSATMVTCRSFAVDFLPISSCLLPHLTVHHTIFYSFIFSLDCLIVFLGAIFSSQSSCPGGRVSRRGDASCNEGRASQQEATAVVAPSVSIMTALMVNANEHKQPLRDHWRMPSILVLPSYIYVCLAGTAAEDIEPISGTI